MASGGGKFADLGSACGRSIANALDQKKSEMAPQRRVQHEGKGKGEEEGGEKGLRLCLKTGECLLVIALAPKGKKKETTISEREYKREILGRGRSCRTEKKKMGNHHASKTGHQNITAAQKKQGYSPRQKKTSPAGEKRDSSCNAVHKDRSAAFV